MGFSPCESYTDDDPCNSPSYYTRGARAFAQTEIKRHRQGLKRDELSSSDVLDVIVFNLGNLARQSI